MPVSPQDFATWSELTGRPYPRTPAERMALAPEVYSFTRNIGRQGGYQPSGIRRAIDVIGKTALAAGAIAGAAYLGKQGFDKLMMDDEPGVPTPDYSSSAVRSESTDVTPPTTSDRYAQDVVPHQTAVMQQLRGTSPAKPTVVDSEEKPATQSQVIGSSQTFGPGDELQQLSRTEAPHTPVIDRVDQLLDEYAGFAAAEQKQQARIDQGVAEYQAGIAGKGERALKQVLKEGRQEGISPVGRSSVQAAEQFRQTPAYASMMKAAGADMEPDELIGGSSQPISFTRVQPTEATRFAVSTPEESGSPIAEMARPKAAPVAPTTAAPASSQPVRRSAESDEAEAFARKALGLMPKRQGASLLSAKDPEAIVTRQPESVRVSDEIDDTTAKLLRQAKAMRTSREEAGGMLSQDIPAGPIHNISVSPANEVAVTYKTKAGTQTYNFDADPKYVNELVDRIKSGSFVEGRDSAGGFINAGRSMGLLQ